MDLSHADEVTRVEDDFFYFVSTFLVGVATCSVLSDPAMTLQPKSQTDGACYWTLAVS